MRIPQRRLVLLDGTAPHTIDPAMPGIDGETLDLGRFLHKEVFKRRREELFVLAEENRAHYKNAFACLSAAGSLRRAAVSEAARSADLTMIRTFLKEGFTLPKEGTPRTLFLTSPTPAGVADFREAQDAENTVYLPGVLGAVFLNEAMKLVQNTQTEIFLHPLTPEAPQCVRIGDTMLVCRGRYPQHIKRVPFEPAFGLHPVRHAGGRDLDCAGRGGAQALQAHT